MKEDALTNTSIHGYRVEPKNPGEIGAERVKASQPAPVEAEEPVKVEEPVKAVKVSSKSKAKKSTVKTSSETSK